MSELISWHGVTTLWIVWLLYWIGSAWGVRRNERGQTASQRLITALVLALGAFLIFARATPLGSLNNRFVPNSFGLRVAALIIVIAGLASRSGRVSTWGSSGVPGSHSRKGTS